MTIALSQRLQILILLSLGLVFTIIYLVFVPHTFAQSVTPTPNTTVRGELKELRETARDDRKVKVCQTHERNIQNRATHLQNLVNKMLTNFDGIATRVENYYTQKLVPQGKTLTNYDTLVADIAAKKAMVTTAVEKTKTDIAGFSCTTSKDPKGDLTTYRIDMQTVKKDLQNYRTSIKNLIVAVSGLAGESSGPSASPTSQ